MQGKAMIGHINLLENREFSCNKVIVDPEKGLVGLVNKIPGVEIDVVGAGDHLPLVDIQIRRLKEMCRAIVSGLPFTLPRNRIDDIVVYSVNRKNTRRTKSLNDNVCPRVRFTGRNVRYSDEYRAGFGDYVEAVDPTVVKNQGGDRCEPCIALYPSANVVGSWVLWNFRTNRPVRRTIFTKLYTPPRVIEIINNIAGINGITKADVITDDITI